MFMACLQGHPYDYSHVVIPNLLQRKGLHCTVLVFVTIFPYFSVWRTDNNIHNQNKYISYNYNYASQVYKYHYRSQSTMHS